MKVKEAILKVSKKWRTYEQLETDVKPLTLSSHETIGRTVRWLQADRLIESKTKVLDFKGNRKSIKVFRKV